jgi:hypothetical protein
MVYRARCSLMTLGGPQPILSRRASSSSPTVLELPMRPAGSETKRGWRLQKPKCWIEN